ncbi:uncharacterized protein TNIN_13641 [Trichonephila inaurata madagascariensis]|uniref:Uncharacterized protein n=1 Tax=Trichonephila inaurata madagascariensis TaxID=2747483 RepID=A0A8X6KPB9_9ARAC|nr:uncharacterized protein TNIN_13641 [Trichonephila inaurata madagascariensis]
MDYFKHPYLLSLRQLAMRKVAITVYLDPEILDFVKDNGSTSFVFPSEAYKCLGVKNPMNETRKTRYLKEVIHKFNLPQKRKRKSSILPFVRWEELVKEKISSLPKVLQHELLGVVRSVSIEIDRWIKDHAEDWQKSPEIAYSFQYDFQWNSHGKIDRVRTGKTLITDKRLEIEDRYLLATLYGLMDKMPIGEKVPHDIVQKYSNLAENRGGRTADG